MLTDTLLKAKIQSRHISSKKYVTYITYSKSSSNNNNGTVNNWICTCHIGKRTVGPCAHATSVILYLSNERYNSAKKSTINIDNIYPEHISDDSSASSDSDHGNNNNNSDSDTSTDIYFDHGDDDQDNLNNQVEHMTIYPDLSAFAATLE